MFSIENRADDKNRIVRIRLLFDSSTPVDQLTAVGRPFAPILPGVLNRLRIGFVSASMRIANPTMECRPRQLPEGIAHRRCAIAVPTRAQWASTCRAHRCRDDVAMSDRHAPITAPRCRNRRHDESGAAGTRRKRRPRRTTWSRGTDRNGTARDEPR
ncbi:hypothetical protein [Burkholderia pseudomallei]|uniref:hypothetical protein n=1 Tax=Burkholderia pseudomallei TaxID=28450 RepID=UPI00016B09EF|nr:hypothetical protein [Burkholderia pseudomallei]